MSMPLLEAAGPLNTIFLPLTSFLPQTDSDDVTIIVNRVSIINKSIPFGFRIYWELNLEHVNKGVSQMQSKLSYISVNRTKANANAQYGRALSILTLVLFATS